MKRRIPFKIDRTDRRGLVVQLTEGLKRLIADGFFKPGDVLPTWREMSEELGISMRVPRDAMARLVSEGVVSSRPHRGAVVLSRLGGSGRRVVIAVAEQMSTSFYSATLIARIRARLFRLGYRVDMVTCGFTPDGKDDISPIETALGTPCELLVSMVENATAWKRIAEWKLPPILFLGDVPRNPIPGCGRITIDLNRANAELVNHCRERGIRRVVEVAMPGRGSLKVCRLLRRVGVEVESVSVRPYRNEYILSALVRGAMLNFSDYLRSHHDDLPDLAVFTDDFIATGALTALLSEGLRVPRDIRIVTFANKGFGPVFPVGLTRMEMDAVSDGDFIAERIVDYLRNQRMPDGLVLGPAYIRGESFL